MGSQTCPYCWEKKLLNVPRKTCTSRSWLSLHHIVRNGVTINSFYKLTFQTKFICTIYAKIMPSNLILFLNFLSCKFRTNNIYTNNINIFVPSSNQRSLDMINLFIFIIINLYQKWLFVKEKFNWYEKTLLSQ